jgi:hypothetical protein
VTARQGKIAVAVTVVWLSVLLLRAAARTGNWVGFAVSEVGLLVPMAISWWILSGPEPGARSRRRAEG